MSDTRIRLAVCFFENKLFYALGEKGKGRNLQRVGSHGFSFSIADAFRQSDHRKLEGVYSVLKNIKNETEIADLQVITFPAHECWTVLPKMVQDEPEEREAYLAILMRGVNRQAIETTWHDISNRDYKILALRDRRIMTGFERMGELIGQTAFNSEFETGSRWNASAGSSGSYMTVCTHPGCISISSYLLGKLRGATIIRFESYDDISYLWEYNAQYLRWMQGLHEQILFYGVKSAVVCDLLKSQLDSAADLLVMDSLKNMGVSAEEETYNFDLSQAFPAVMYALHN